LIKKNRIIYNQGDLNKLDLNERQIKAVLYVKENGRITNREYQKINDCSRNTACTELKKMETDYNHLVNKGYGAGSFYELIAHRLHNYFTIIKMPGLCRIRSTK